MELGVGIGSDEVHILGYGIDTKGRPLQNALDQLAGERIDRMEKMLAALGRLGVALTLEDVQAETGGDIVGRLHLAAALVRLGHVTSHGEAFQRWIGAGRPAYVQRQLLTLREAIDLIREAGGVAVVAHPGLTRRDELIEYLVRLGVRGLEVYHPKHDFVDVSRYLKMCAKFDLFATGGSDFHGVGKLDQPPGSASTPRTSTPELLKYIKRLVARLQRNSRSRAALLRWVLACSTPLRGRGRCGTSDAAALPLRRRWTTYEPVTRHPFAAPSVLSTQGAEAGSTCSAPTTRGGRGRESLREDARSRLESPGR